LALAKTRVASLPVDNPANATLDVEKLGNPFLVSLEEAKRAKEAADSGVGRTEQNESRQSDPNNAVERVAE
jgi:hypothetical protein